MVSSVPFQDYLTPNTTSAGAKRERAKAFLAGQKDNIDRCIRKLRPKRIVFLGAGALNDIPIETSIAEGAEIFCVDWMRDVMEPAYKERVVQILQERTACIICNTAGNPLDYCLSYHKPEEAPAGDSGAQGTPLCDNFIRARRSFPLCENYVPGAFPNFIVSDVTQGYAAHVADGLGSILERAQKPRKAMSRAVLHAKRRQTREVLPIEDDSVDFVTSSMVASQFDFEPFTYFVGNLVKVYGLEALERAAKDLSSLEEELRDTLLIEQMKGHCEEIVRLLRPGGRIYFSMEMLHQSESGGDWFQPKTVPKILDVLNRYFFYDLDFLTDFLATEIKDSVQSGRSMIQTSILKPIGNA